MTADRDLDRTLSSWFEDDAPAQVPDRVMRATFERTRTVRQQAGWEAVLVSRVGRPVLALGTLAVAIVLAVAGLGLAFGLRGGVGVPPSATPTPSATPRALPDSGLEPGSYVTHPLPVPGDRLTVSFTVPDGWMNLGPDALVPVDEPGTGPPGGVAIQLVDVTVLDDPCDWSGTADDVRVGPGVDDLVAALRSQTAYEVSDPIDVTIGGQHGKRVDIVMPTQPFAAGSSEAPACDSGHFRPWDTSAHGEGGIYAQGPANRWQTNVLDVDGTRLVVVVSDFPGTSAVDRAGLDAIVGSLVIEP